MAYAVKEVWYDCHPAGTFALKSVEVLESLKPTFPEKNSVANTWKFEKAHSILNKVRELFLFGWSENFSTQGPEHCHIDFVKKIALEFAHGTNNKEVFLTILRHHVRESRLQYLNQVRHGADLYAEDIDEIDEACNYHDRMKAK